MTALSTSMGERVLTQRGRNPGYTAGDQLYVVNLSKAVDNNPTPHNSTHHGMSAQGVEKVSILFHLSKAHCSQQGVEKPSPWQRTELVQLQRAYVVETGHLKKVAKVTHPKEDTILHSMTAYVEEQEVSYEVQPHSVTVPHRRHLRIDDGTRQQQKKKQEVQKIQGA